MKPLEFPIAGGVVVLKPGTPQAIINHVRFLISHHGYGVDKFQRVIDGKFELAKNIKEIRKN